MPNKEASPEAKALAKKKAFYLRRLWKIEDRWLLMKKVKPCTKS
jgi:hypothetical protein